MTRDPRPIEFDIHCGVASLLRAAARPEVMWTCFPAGEKRDPITGARLKRMGMKRGWADFILIVNDQSEFDHGRPVPCFLEIKRPGEKQSPDQVAVQLQCEALGARYAIARSVTEAHAVLSLWGALRGAQGQRRAA